MQLNLWMFGIAREEGEIYYGNYMNCLASKQLHLALASVRSQELQMKNFNYPNWKVTIINKYLLKSFARSGMSDTDKFFNFLFWDLWGQSTLLTHFSMMMMDSWRISNLRQYFKYFILKFYSLCFQFSCKIYFDSKK